MINQLFGSTDPSPLTLIRKRRWWLRGEEHSAFFVDLTHAQHINWGLYKAPSIDYFFPGDQQLVSHRWRLFKHPFGWGQFCRCCLLCFIFSLHSGGCGWDDPTCPHFWMDRQNLYQDNLLSWMGNFASKWNAVLYLNCLPFPPHFSSPPSLCVGYEYSDEPWCDYTVQLLVSMVEAKALRKDRARWAWSSFGVCFPYFSPISVALRHMQMSLLFFIKP